MKDLDKLWKLQEMELKKRKAEKDTGIEGEAQTLQQLIAGYKKLADSMRPMAETYKRNLVSMGELQETQSKLEKQIQDAETSLYKGEENNSKTLQALQDEIQVLLEKLEPTTELIKQMEQQRKKAQRQLMSLNQKAEKRKQIINESKIHLQQHQSEHQEKAHALDQRIESVRRTIDSESLQKYDDLKKRRMPVIVESSHGVCKGCNMQVSMVMSQTITQNDGDESQTLICENCGRILYVREETTLVTN